MATRARRTPAYWAEAGAALAGADPVMATLIARYPGAAPRGRGNAFEALARSIAGQQISVKAADTIWTRLQGELGTCCAESVLGARPEALRACGLSGRKVEYLQALAGHFAAPGFSVRGWARLDDEAVIQDLTRIRGIGRWTVEMFLMFHLQRPDVLPVGDVGLQRAVSLHYGADVAARPDRLRQLGERWAPYRSVATWYLWRSLDGEGA